MKIEESFQQGRLIWQLDSSQVYIRELEFSVPPDWDPDQTHNDLHGAAALLALRPFVGRQLQLPRAVSRHFATVAEDEFGVEVTPVDPELEPRTLANGRVGLAYSGGVDSTAALLLLPADTCCMFVERTGSEGDKRPTMYRPDAALHAVRTVESAGWDVVFVGTNLEYVGEKVGFPVTDASSVESSGVPLVLLADHLGLNAISWGTVAEVTYGVGFGGFKDHMLNIEHRRWRSLLAAADLGVLLPLAGVSEVGAARIVRGSPLEAVAQSCVRGAEGRPCLNCVKCVRKTLTTAAVSGEWPSADEIERLFLVPQFRTTLRRMPVPLADVYRFALSRCPVSSDLIELLKLRFAARGAAAGYLQRAYAPASEAWPRDRRADVGARLEEQLGWMSEEDIAEFTAWNPFTRDHAEPMRTFAEALVDHLDARAGQPHRASGLIPLERSFLQIEGPDDAELHAAIERLTPVLARDGGSARTRAHRRSAAAARNRLRRLIRRLGLRRVTPPRTE